MVDNTPIPDGEFPARLAHKPLFVLDYVSYDGRFANQTDARLLSFGCSQWNPQQELSLKVLRHSGKRWSRLSEEIPPYRALDLSIFLAWSLFKADTPLPPGTLWNQREPVLIRKMPRPSVPRGKVSSLSEFFENDPDEVNLLKNRLNALRDVLNQLKNEGSF